MQMAAVLIWGEFLDWGLMSQAGGLGDRYVCSRSGRADAVHCTSSSPAQAWGRCRDTAEPGRGLLTASRVANAKDADLVRRTLEATAVLGPIE